MWTILLSPSDKCVHGLDWSKLRRSANSRFINGQHSSEDLKMLSDVSYELFSCNNCISFIFRLLNKVPKGRKLNVMTVALNIVLTWIMFKDFLVVLMGAIGSLYLAGYYFTCQSS